MALCSTDSGSGLVFPIEINGKMKYFLRGVASIGTSNGTCDRNVYSTFINVEHVEPMITHFIGNFTAQLEHSDIGPKPIATLPRYCILEFIPENGYALNLDDLTDEYLKTNIQNYQTIIYGCYENYTLKGDQTTDCIDGTWTNTVPECIPFSTGFLTGMAQLKHARSLLISSVQRVMKNCR